MKKYVIKRNEVCAGRLIKNVGLSFAESYFNNKDIDIKVESQGINIFLSYGFVCRGMLFNVTEDGLANDLMYTTPINYPIINKDPKTCDKNEYFVDRYTELEELLKYLNYGADLTQSDLNQIYRKLIINDSWLNRNKKLFIRDEKANKKVYDNDEGETIPMEIYQNLNNISCCKNGKPYIEEPCYRLIKKIK